MPHQQPLSTASPFLVMGIVNITPDSFSDGGDFYSPSRAIEHAYQLLEEGADLLDLGAESSRPGALAVSEDEEWKRLKPVLEHFSRSTSPMPFLSVDTYKPKTMLQAVDLGAAMVNNIEGIPEISVLKRLSGYPEVHYAAMHKHGTPESMQNAPLASEEALETVTGFFQKTFETLRDAGFSEKRIWLDPGIGFGKTDSANFMLLKNIPNYARSFENLLVGISRKSFIGRALDISNPLDRDPATKMLELGAAFLGAKMIRTHDVKTLIGLRKQLV